MKKLVGCIVLLCMSVFVSPSFAVLYIDSISLDFGECYYYDNTNSQFNLSTPMGASEIAIDVGNIHIYGASTWDYDLAETGKISVTPSNQTYFAGTTAGFSGGTITLTATKIREKATGDIVFEDTDGFVLLTAQVDVATWYLYESSAKPDKFISSPTLYDVTGGELDTGTTFKMLDFNTYWAFPQTTPQDSAFDADLRCINPAVEFIATSVPEPATLMLLGLGGLLLRRKK